MGGFIGLIGLIRLFYRKSKNKKHKYRDQDHWNNQNSARSHVNVIKQDPQPKPVNTQKEEHSVKKTLKPNESENVLRQRQPKKIVLPEMPVKPKQIPCENQSCNNKPSFLCRFCNFHVCSTCKKDACIKCSHKNIEQPFESCYNCCEDIYDCYLTTCKHIHHEECLKLWHAKNITNPKCLQCLLPFKLEDISTDFYSGLFEIVK